MGVSCRTCWFVGVIALFFAHCACVTNSEEAQRFIKDSFWNPAEEHSYDAARWAGLNPEENAIQSEDQIYGEDLEIPTNEKESLMESPSDSSAQGRSVGYRRYRDYIRNRDRGERRQAIPLRGGEISKRRQGPRGFYASRGKRFIPGLESLLLAKYYQGRRLSKSSSSSSSSPSSLLSPLASSSAAAASSSYSSPSSSLPS
ncbi:tachykinin-2 [Elysia marginata]|uniref:Tachykinin-2 n=1 Tax=Elysia marginata TaxID=1093978 RepID=A0AAV4IFV8_9GAST|nr:tachykinin-2 [Elysia marginata]